MSTRDCRLCVPGGPVVAPAERLPMMFRVRSDATPGSPPKDVLAAFGVSGTPIALKGGRGSSWRADHLVLKPADTSRTDPRVAGSGPRRHPAGQCSRQPACAFRRWRLHRRWLERFGVLRRPPRAPPLVRHHRGRTATPSSPRPCRSPRLLGLARGSMGRGRPRCLGRHLARPVSRFATRRSTRGLPRASSRSVSGHPWRSDWQRPVRGCVAAGGDRPLAVLAAGRVRDCDRGR